MTLKVARLFLSVQTLIDSATSLFCHPIHLCLAMLDAALGFCRLTSLGAAEPHPLLPHDLMLSWLVAPSTPRVDRSGQLQKWCRAL